MPLRRLKTPPCVLPRLLGLGLSLLALASLTPSNAAFTAKHAQLGTFAADALDAPTGLTASRTCAAPAFRSSSLNGAVGTTTTVPKPSGLTSGDVMVAFAVTGGLNPITASGWTQLHEMQAANGTWRSSYFWRRATSSEGTGYTFSFATNGFVIISAYSGVDSIAVPYDGSSLVGTNVTSTSATLPTVTTASAATRLVYGAAVQQAQSVTLDAALTRRDGMSVSGSGTFLMADETLATAGTSSARTFSWSGSQHSFGAIVALRASSSNVSGVTLTWTATADTYATGYERTRSPGSTTSISGRTTTSSSDTTTADGTEYTYSLVSVAGSWRSSAATVTVPRC